MWTYFVHMKIVTVRDLRNSFSMLERWLAEGEEIRMVATRPGVGHA
jgi:antitoxin (DNA-binding transcriptional repressor) of toxin-antitoxin stability system